MTQSLSCALLARGSNASWDTGVYPGATRSRVPRTHPLPTSLSCASLPSSLARPVWFSPSPAGTLLGVSQPSLCWWGSELEREVAAPPGGASLPQPHSPSPDRCAQHDALPWARCGEQGGRVLPLWGLQWGSRQADVSRLNTETACRGERLPGCEQAWGRGD